MSCIFCSCQEEKKVPDDFTIYGHQFQSPPEYQNPFLKGRYRLYLRGLGQLIKGVEWDYLPDGGFKILPPLATSNDTIINGEFY